MKLERIPLIANWLLALVVVLAVLSYPAFSELPPEIRFLHAAYYGDVSKINGLLRKGVDVNTRDPSGSTALIFASQQGHVEALKLLVDKGADVNATTMYRNDTALLQAAKNGHYEVIELLIQNGADVNAMNSSNKTALKWAALKRRKRIAELLLKHGANVDAGINKGSTALMEAAQGGDVGLVKLFIENGANVNAKDYAGRTVADRATWEFARNSFEVGQILKSAGAEISIRNAVRFGDKELVLQRLTSGSDVNERDGESGQTLLMDAVDRKNVEMMKLLLKKGADVNARDFSGRTPLMVAVDRYSIQMMKLILEKGADVNTESSSGETALSRAIRLVKVNSDFSRPISSDLKLKFVRMIKLLLDKGADLVANTKSRKTPLELALGISDPKARNEIVKLLKDHGAVLTLPALVNIGDVTKVRRFLRINPDVGLKDKSRALLDAIAKKRIDLVKALIEAGADINAIHGNGWSPLMFAADRRYIEMAKVLLTKGADINAKDAAGRTPLMWAVASSLGNNPSHELINLFLDKDADINAKDMYGRTALMRAAIDGNTDIAKLLLKKGADVHSRDMNGITPLILAVMGGGDCDWKLDRSLNQKPKHKNRRVDTHFRSGRVLTGTGDRVKMIKLLMKNGADINAKDQDGDTALAAAIRLGDGYIVDYLKSRGAKMSKAANQKVER